MVADIYIAGASSRARTAKEYLETLYPDIRVQAFLVSPEMTDNPESVDGIPVLTIAANTGLDTDHAVYLGTRGVNHGKLTEELTGAGFSAENIIPVSPGLDIRLRNEYVRRLFEEKGKAFIKFENSAGARVKTSPDLHGMLYIAKTTFDSDFREPVALIEGECILQAGAELADHVLPDAAFCDNIGDSISDRNRQFCELTAMYWIWKNSDTDIVGLEHWRRRFLLPVNWRSEMADQDIDVILPVPLCVMPSLEGNFVDRHLPEIWDASMKALREIHPEDAGRCADFCRSERIYSPCNMIIARKPIFDEYSAWLFPVLFRVNELIGTVEDKYQNRYPGFVSERLLNYFFNTRRSELKVAYADKNFLQ